MKTLISLLALVSALSASAQTVQTVQKTQIACQNSQGQSFTILPEGNPRNGAAAQLANVSDQLNFGGAWLWLTSSEDGFSALTEYKTMNGGKLSVSEHVSLSQCTRVECSMKKTINAEYLANETAEPVSFDCH